MGHIEVVDRHDSWSISIYLTSDIVFCSLWLGPGNACVFWASGLLTGYHQEYVLPFKWWLQAHHCARKNVTAVRALILMKDRLSGCLLLSYMKLSSNLPVNVLITLNFHYHAGEVDA